MKNSQLAEPMHEEISQRAQEIWIQAGRPEGRDLEHWIQAENWLREERRLAEQITLEPAQFNDAQPSELQSSGKIGTSKTSIKSPSGSKKKQRAEPRRATGR